MDEIPQGFVPLYRSSPFLDAIGPFFCRGSGSGLVLGLRTAPRHVNSRGLAHGGLLASVADTALGYALESVVQQPASRGVTASLSLDFAGSAKLGDWIESTVDIQKIGTRLAFANAYLSVGETRIVRASAVFLMAEK